VRHHFIDELDLGTPFSAGAFARQAYERIPEILGRGRTPLVVGGSTLYLHAILHGLAAVPAVDPAVRRHLEARLATEGPHRLYDELRRADPRTAATLDPTKTQRLVRALEVFHGTGRPLSAYFEDQPPLPYRFAPLVLVRERAELYERINRRVDAMLAAGLLDEVRGLLDRGVDPSLNALRTIGYEEAIACLQGRLSYDEMVRLIKRNTRRYAKRQLTWFRSIAITAIL
jgi:tRNA dimethylallyltransferase